MKVGEETGVLHILKIWLYKNTYLNGGKMLKKKKKKIKSDNKKGT